MEAHTFLIQIVLILFLARIFGEIASYFKIPAVLGELIAGIVIGPSLLGLVDMTVPIFLLSQIGLILLLFEVGLETDVGRLSSAGFKASIVAVVGVLLPLALGFFVSYEMFNFSLLASLFIGSTLTATSIGITLRVLRDLKQQNSRESQIVLGAAVIDDILGIILLAMLYEFSKSGVVNYWNAGKIFVFVVLFFLITPIAVKAVSMVIKKWDEKSEIPGLLPTTIVSLILLFSWIAYVVGAPEMLGGFAAGLALSKQFYFKTFSLLRETPEFSQRIEKQMKPIVHLFTPIFFVGIGLSLDLKSVDWHSSYIWLLTGVLLLVGIIGKLASGFVLRKESFMSKLTIGTAMIPRGEVGLIFANIGLTSGVYKNDVYASIILVITLTTLLAPFLLRMIYNEKRGDNSPLSGF